MKDDPPITREAYLHASRDTASLPPERSIQEAVIRHAQGDLAGDKSRFAEWRDANAAQRPTFSSELFAMIREAVNDIRQTFNQVMWGQAENAAETGTPLHPVPMEVYQDRHQEAPTQETQSYESALAASAARTRDRDDRSPSR